MQKQPLAQSYTVIDRVPKADNQRGVLADGPGVLRLPSGRLLANYHFRTNKDTEPGADRLKFAVSEDEGQSWRRVSALPYCDGLTFVHENKLHLIAFEVGRKNVIALRSDDEGETWSEPVKVLDGYFWNSPAGYVIANGHLYYALGASPKGSWDEVCVIAGNLGRDLLDPAAWRVSNRLRYPGTPTTLSTDIWKDRTDGQRVDHWLESNIVHVGGRLRVYQRLRIGGYATVGMTAICDLEDDGQELQFRFTQFHPFPGAQNMFHIIHDEVSGLYWMLCNLVTDSLDSQKIFDRLGEAGYKGTPGNERRLLILHYSLDSLNWFQAGCVAMSKNPLQSFHYTTPFIDGDNLLIISRTSVDAPNQHDSDLVTFHVVQNFRDLALDLRPEMPAGA